MKLNTFIVKQEEEINNNSDNVLPDFSFSSIEDNEGVKE